MRPSKAAGQFSPKVDSRRTITRSENEGSLRSEGVVEGQPCVGANDLQLDVPPWATKWSNQVALATGWFLL